MKNGQGFVLVFSIIAISTYVFAFFFFFPRGPFFVLSSHDGISRSQKRLFLIPLQC
jgi:hypothetical protein